MAWALGGAALVVVLAGLALFEVVVTVAGRGSDPWRAKVVSVDGERVCTVPDVGQKDPGWSNPLCFDRGLTDHADQAVTLKVGECVELHVHHPAFISHGIVPCVRQS